MKQLKLPSSKFPFKFNLKQITKLADKTFKEKLLLFMLQLLNENKILLSNINDEP
jgi:hypothetical protein